MTPLSSLHYWDKDTGLQCSHEIVLVEMGPSVYERPPPLASLKDGTIPSKIKVFFNV